MAYTVYNPTSKGTRDSRPIISLRVNGKIGLNIIATRLLMENGVERVQVLWDAQKRKIALAAAPDGVRGYKVYVNEKGNQATIGIRSLGAFIGLSPNRTVKAIATYSNKMLEATIPDEAFRIAAGGVKKGKRVSHK